MRASLKVDKAIQAAAVLMAMEPSKEIDRLRLLKLLYIAEREALSETGRPITFDRAVALDHGPVLSGVYDLIKGQHIESPRWARFFENHGHVIHLNRKPGNGLLSRYEIAKLQAVSLQRLDRDTWSIAQDTHELPEYQKNRPTDGSSNPIPLEDILDAVGRSDEKDSIIQDIEDSIAAARFISLSRPHERRSHVSI